METTGAEVVARAQRIAQEVLFPASLLTDAAELLPASILDVLADEGFYGLTCPTAVGGLGVDASTAWSVVEALAGGCLTTTFVWLQHLGGARAAALATGEVHEQWAAALCRGERRAGVAFAHLRRPGPPAVRATPRPGGWSLDGTAPWVTGWGRIDVVHTAARWGDDVVWLLVDARASPTLDIERLPLAALDASGTVAMTLSDHMVPAERMTRIEPFTEWLAADALGLRTNGSLALGIAGRCCTLLSLAGAIDLEAAHAELDACRDALDGADRAEGTAMALARASASTLALRLASLLVVSGGGRSIIRDHHAQRLAREALFLLVQGQTPTIKAAESQLLGPLSPPARGW